MVDRLSPVGSVLAIDVGGTTIKVEVVGPTCESWARAVTATPQGEAAVEAIIKLGRSVLNSLRPDQRSQVGAVGLALPGILDMTAGRSVRSVNIGWRDMPVGQRVSEALGMSVSIGHDATLAGLAEWRLGAGRHGNDVLIVVIGTGISAAIISGGQLVCGGAGQAAGELGHMIVRPGGDILSLRCTRLSRSSRLGVRHCTRLRHPPSLYRRRFTRRRSCPCARSGRPPGVDRGD
jgi:glucokinase